MKLFGLQLKREKIPTLESIHPPVFNVYHLWKKSLFSFCLLVLVGVLIGGKFFFDIYSEEYRNTELDTLSDSGPELNINSLTRAVDRRAEALFASTTIPSDPSI